MRGVSTTKFCKGTGLPKRSGNFSPHTIYLRGWQSKDYPVIYKNGILTVGANTPLATIMPAGASIAEADPYFKEYRQEGVHTHRGKQYECYKILTLRKFFWGKQHQKQYTYREAINTENEFEYEFPEY